MLLKTRNGLFSARSENLKFFALLVAVSIACIYRNVQSGFWLDETFTGAVSCQPDFATMMPLIRHDAHPLLYNTLVHLIFGIVGCHLWAIRAVSLVASGFAVWLLIRATRAHGGSWQTILALTAGNPVFWVYAFEARAYGLLYLAGAGTVTFAISSKPGDNAKAAAFALLGGLLHYIACFLFAVLVLFKITGLSRNRNLKEFWLSFFVALGVLCGVYALQLPSSLSGSGSLQLGTPSLSTLGIFATRSIFYNPVSSCMFFIMIVSSFSICLYLRYPVSSEVFMFSVYWLFATLLFIISLYRSIFSYKYTHFLIPVMVLGSSFIINKAIISLSAYKLSKGKDFSYVSDVLLLLFMLFNLITVMDLPVAQRADGWQRALESMDCTEARPCGFVLDDNIDDFLTDAQYDALARFLAPEPRGIIPVHRENMEAWLEERPGARLLYVQPYNPSVDLDRLIAKIPLACDKTYLLYKQGGIPCRALAIPQGAETPPR